MVTLDVNSPEGKLAAANAELASLRADKARLEGELAKHDRSAIEKLKAERDAAITEQNRLRVALDSANTRLAAKGEAPSLTTMEQIKARASGMSAAPLPTGNVLTRAEKDALYAQMAKLPAGEQRSFYERNIKGKIAA